MMVTQNFSLFSEEDLATTSAADGQGDGAEEDDGVEYEATPGGGLL